MVNKHATSFIFIIVLFFISCTQENKKYYNNKVPVNGGAFYGEVFRVNEVSDFKSLYPHNTTEVVGYRIASQVYEGLLKFSQNDLSVMPNLAERWEVSDNAMSFTFYLQKGVRFHDDSCFANNTGRELTAYDVEYCFTKLCEASATNNGFWVFKDKVLGASEYYESTVSGNPLPEGVEGIKVIGKYSIQINLKFPYSSFYNIFCTPFTYIFPKEAVDKYGDDIRTHCVGTGPFRVATFKEGEVVYLAANENYWKKDSFGNRLPYLNGVKISFIKDKQAELIEFWKRNLDMVYRLPVEMIDEVIADFEDRSGSNDYFELQITPALNVQYYGFLHTSKLFSNINVRKAFNYAIDREKIVNYTLKGEGIPGKYGFVPPSFKEYKAELIKGYDFNPDLARDYLQKAGYPNGKGFPQITLNVNNNGGSLSRNIQVAEIVQKMLKEHLNINVEINQLSFPQHLSVLESGNALFWRQSWIADYPDPENFLNLLYGKHLPKGDSEKSYLNTFRYKSEKFDSLFAEASRQTDSEKRYQILRKADQLAIDEAAFMPIYYDENYRLINKRIKNFPSNAMEFRDFSEVYMVTKSEIAYSR